MTSTRRIAIAHTILFWFFLLKKFIKYPILSARIHRAIFVCPATRAFPVPPVSRERLSARRFAGFGRACSPQAANHVVIVSDYPEKVNCRAAAPAENCPDCACENCPDCAC